MEIDFPSLTVIAGTGCHAHHGAAGVFPQVDSVLEPQPTAYPRRPSRMANMSQHGHDDAASTSGRPLPYLDEARYITPTPRLSATLLRPQRRVSPRYTLLVSVKARHADWPPPASVAAFHLIKMSCNSAVGLVRACLADLDPHSSTSRAG